MRGSVGALLGWGTMAALLAGIAIAQAAEPAAPGLAEKVDAPHLPNAYHIHPKVISGGLPEGEAGFAELENLGVKTIITVDGPAPDVTLARRHGMRYVHLPHGYDGIPAEQVQQLALAVRDLEGPIYIHCHHGKHRSPAAATVACISAGMLPADSGKRILQTAGTSPHYRGLYASAESALPIDPAVLNRLEPHFPEKAPVPPLVEAMGQIEHAHDHLKSLAANDWKKLDNHPDLDPAHEALLLREQFTEMLRTDEVRREPAEFQRLAKASETDAQRLEDVLRVWQAKKSPQPTPTAARKALDLVTAHCTACHKQYRDVPLGEKRKP